MVVSLLILIILFVLPVLRLWRMSPGKPQALTDKQGQLIAGSISEKVFVPIGGSRQGMFIRTKDSARPVLLFIHGGPGFPNYFLIEAYNPGLEDYFTVCYWEQRGCGLSYDATIDPESLTLEQLAADALEVTNYLRRRFAKEKIYLLAWSGGTAIALPLLQKAPELFHAYLAMGQLTRQYESEKIGYDWMMQQLKEKKMPALYKKLARYKGLRDSADMAAYYQSSARDEAMHRLGVGTMRQMKSVFNDIFLAVWRCRAYTIAEKTVIWKAKLLLLPRTKLKSATLTTDFEACYPSLNVAVYFFGGLYDYTVNTGLSRAYMQRLKAPLKGFYTFDNAAHGPLFEDPEHFRMVIEKDVLCGKTTLADVNAQQLNDHVQAD